MNYESGPFIGQATATHATMQEASDRAQYMADEYLIPYCAWSIGSAAPWNRGDNRQAVTCYPQAKKRSQRRTLAGQAATGGRRMRE